MKRSTLISRLGFGFATLITSAMFIDSAQAQTYTVRVLSWTTDHTRAHTTDTVYIALAGSVLNPYSPYYSLAFLKTKEGCEGIESAPPVCVTVKMGNYRDGVHEAGYGNIVIGQRDDDGVGKILPTISLDVSGVPEANQSSVVGISVWNYGFPKLLVAPEDMSRALVAALLPIIDNKEVPGENSLIKPLNHHPWLGCDGPVIGAAFRYSAADLARMTAAGPATITIGPVRVASQVGCGASSKYSVTVSVSRND